MSAHKNLKIFSSGEDTDSADETFVFAKKRKAHPFFLDCSDGQIAKKNICLEKNVSKQEVIDVDAPGPTTPIERNGQTSRLKISKVFCGEEGQRHFSLGADSFIELDSVEVVGAQETVETLPDLVSAEVNPVEVKNAAAEVCVIAG